MSLGEELKALRDGGTAELDAAYDYYADTKLAWRLVRRQISAGRKFP